MRMTMMTGLERLKMICEAPHADGVIRLTRERLRGIIEQIEDDMVEEVCRAEDITSDLTHEAPDSWERLEEEKVLNPFDYCKKVGYMLSTCENAERFKSSDLVRRAKALNKRGL